MMRDCWAESAVRRRGRMKVVWVALLLVTFLVAACTGSSSASPGSTVPAASSGAPSRDLSFCDALAVVDIRAPDGSAIVLDGDWMPAETDFPTDIVNAFLRQAGDCVWIVSTVAFPEDPSDVLGMWEFHGRLGSDFRIRGEFSEVQGSYPGDPWSYGPFTFRIEVVDGELALVEDREPGEPAPGCSGLPGSCPDPVRLVRAP